jgi:hypothetical protein
MHAALRQALLAEPTLETGRGAPEDQIEAVEAEFDRLPDDYRRFLGEFGWVSCRHYEVSGLGADVSPAVDLVLNARSEHADYGLPASLLPLHNNGGGDL